MKIRLEQAVFGEKDRGHSLLKHSFDSSSIPNQISLKTDLPSGHSSFPSYNFYYSTISTTDYYVLIKSFPDSSAQRSGFVYSYSLFIKNSDLKYLNDLCGLFTLFPDSINKEFIVDTIEIETENGVAKSLGDINKAKKIAYGLLNVKLPIVWLGQEGFVETVSIIWNNLNPTLKSNFQFRVSFGPKDIEKTNEQIVYSPIGLKDKWENYFVLNESDNFDKEYSDDIKYLIENKSDNNTTEKYIKEIGINISSFSDIKKTTLLNELLEDNSFDSLLNSIALLSQLLPKKESGKKIKKEIIEEISSKLKGGNINNILKFRNVDIKHLKEIYSIKKEIGNILQNWDYKIEADQLFTSITDKGVQKWWKDIINSSLKKCFSIWDVKHSKLFWNLITKDISNLKLIRDYVPTEKEVEKRIIINIPKKLNVESEFELINLSIKRKWYLLHASVLCKLYSIEDSIERQLEIDSNEDYFESLEIIASNFGFESFIDYSSKNPKKKLIDFSIKLIEENPNLLSKIKVANHGWINIWSTCEEKNITAYDYVDEPLSLTHKLLKEYLYGKEINHNLLLKISNSNYNDLSNFPERIELWKSLSNPIKTNFANSTTCLTELQKYLISNEFSVLEEKLVDSKAKEVYIRNLVSNNQKDINSGLILGLFEQFTFQEELFLLFLSKHYSKFDYEVSRRIGELIKKREWKKSYKAIKEKYVTYNGNLKVAIEMNSSLFSFKSLFSWDSNKNTNPMTSTNNNENVDSNKKILIVVATPLEAKMVLSQIKKNGHKPIPETINKMVFWHLGKINGSSLIMQKTTTMGSSGVGGSSLSVQDALNIIKPDAVVMLGIAFGLNKDKQKIGTVLVSKQIECYELSKIKENSVIQRADKIPASHSLVNMFENAEFDFDQCDLEFGLMVSGEKLVDNEEFVNRLKKTYPEAIGGEMEGEGLRSACHRNGVDWILMKGICDWGFNKNTPSKKDDQKLAISNACDFLLYTLKRFNI
jgi:nucleoside phosphorylase